MSADPIGIGGDKAKASGGGRHIARTVFDLDRAIAAIRRRQ
jgi:hypothetical protein